METSEYINLGIPENIYKNISGKLENDFDLWLSAVISYYDTDSDEEPIMSDQEFDELNDALKNNNIVGSWIKSVIYRNGKFEIKHTDYEQEMISLFKIKWASTSRMTDINNFWKLSGNRLSELIRTNNIWFARKYDGCSLKITHNQNGSIKSIITRGGIDVTETFKKHPAIQELYSHFGTKIICGELMIRNSVFNEKYSVDAGGNYENPRNYIGGIVKKKDISQEVLNDLVFIPCTDGIDPLLMVGYKHYKDVKYAINSVHEFIWHKLSESSLYVLDKILHEFREKEDLLYDGIVLATHTLNHERQVKDNYPLNMVAIKFPAPKATTQVIGFDWTQKKSGKLTPRLMLKPVKLDGSTVSFANGYNIDRVIANGIGIGAIVEIEKSGDIIPIVSKVLSKSRDIQYPKVPYKRVGKHLLAIDEHKSKVFKFVAGLKLLQIQGIGDTIAEQIGKVLDYNILEVFNSNHKPEILKEIGTGAVWQKFLEVYNIKTLHLDELINILQFDNVGPKISKKIANLLLKKSTDTTNISSDVLANVCRGEGCQQIRQAMQTLAKYGIRTINPVEITGDTVTFEMSGNPPKMTKSEFEKRFKEVIPTVIHTTLTKETSLLVVDNISGNSSKILKARKYNIPIITYQDALAGKIPELKKKK